MPLPKEVLNGLYGSICYKNGIEKIKEVAEMKNKIARNQYYRTNRDASGIYAVVNGKAYTPETITAMTGFRENLEYEFSVTIDPRYEVVNTAFAIKNVIFNPPATIVFWGDGSKTVVKCQDDEEYDPEKGLTMAFFKRTHGNVGHYFEEIKKWTSDFSKVEDNDKLKDLVDGKLKAVAEKNTKWAIFYAKSDRGEDEGYIRYPVVYAHKSSAIRAAKKLISKLPSSEEYTWFVDSIEE